MAFPRRTVRTDIDEYHIRDTVSRVNTIIDSQPRRLIREYYRNLIFSFSVSHLEEQGESGLDGMRGRSIARVVAACMKMIGFSDDSPRFTHSLALFNP